jgi:hypothetical protein
MLANPHYAENYGNWLIAILNEHGRKNEAEGIREELEKKKAQKQ